MDAVQSSRFITQKKSDALLRKLEGLASVHQAGQLQRQVFVDRNFLPWTLSSFLGPTPQHSGDGAP